MTGIISEDYETEVRYASTEDMSDGQRYQSSDSLAEWRSCEQVENGTPSTSPPFWDTDDDEDDTGPKPSELYGKFTWKIESFSQISKRELRSNAFEVGGYKWYILIYPQGCDVCNHLSLFLCVANHDKLLPGWSHFAQFTIAVVNKDPKKSKYSDTLHRFWKKEHDWGWKKFMELSKVSDGFIVADTLVIKAQVQVIREKSNRPFRCLDSQYRRELVRVYFSNVDQICRRFVEERRGKLSKLIEDRVRWSSFRVFWHGLDLNSRQQMSREKSDGILKVVVKHFFIEKEVTSTLVMDSLYSGLKALESQSKLKKGGASPTELEEMPLPFVFLENDMFILADDVLLLLDRASMEPMPAKDDKGLQSQSSNQNRTKDGNSGDEANKDPIERDERRLTELGRRTVEILVLAHIFSSRIEVAYQEAVALKRQEELIREEEAAWQAESELKAKRGTEKDKRAKKKQAKQKRNNRKAKDKTKEDKVGETLQESRKIGSPLDERRSENFLLKPVEHISEKVEISEDASDVTDAGDDVIEAPHPDTEDRVSSPSNCDVDAMEFFPRAGASGESLNGQLEKKVPFVDDSSSTCSSDSVPSVVMNGPYKGNSLQKVKEFDSSIRGKSQRAKTLVERAGHARREPESSRPAATTASSQDATESAMSVSGSALSLTDRIPTPEHLVEKQDIRTLQKRKSVRKLVDGHSIAKTFTPVPPSALATPVSASSSLQQTRQPSEKHVLSESVCIKEPQSYNSNQTEKPVLSETKALQSPSISISEAQRLTPMKVPATPQESSMSRPSSAPIIPVPEPTVSVASTVHPVPLFSRSASATGRLGYTEPLSSSSCASQPYAPQSYRNAIMGKTSMVGVPYVIPRPSSCSSSQASTSSMSIPAFIPSSVPSSLTRTEQSSVQPGFTLGSVSRGILNTGSHRTDSCSAQEASGSILRDSSIISDTVKLDLNAAAPSFSYNSVELGSHANMRQPQCVAPDEFPHLDIIEYLLDEEQQVISKAESDGHSQQFMNRQHTFPGCLSMADPVLSNGPRSFDNLDQYYDDSVQRMYGSSSGSFEGRMEFSPSRMEPSYGSGPNGLMSSRQWPVGTPDHPILGLSALERHGSSYQVLDYPNLTRGFNAHHNMYRPANGR